MGKCSKRAEGSWPDRYGGKAKSLYIGQKLARAITVTLDEEMENKMVENERLFAERHLIERFKGFWPSLSDLNEWISETWGPILEGDVQIYSGARGFFVVVFDNEREKNKIICGY
ncbi:hypothetical protein SUGI_0995970 [Cryptomeria japonica]|nr:hypothetical protein SUGI_0995970 [Cryptomeria japonica]